MLDKLLTHSATCKVCGLTARKKMNYKTMLIMHIKENKNVDCSEVGRKENRRFSL